MAKKVERRPWPLIVLHDLMRDAMVVALWKYVKFTGPDEGRRFADAWIKYWMEFDSGRRPRVATYAKKASDNRDFQAQFKKLVADPPKSCR